MLPDRDKTKEQPKGRLTELRQQVDGLETLEKGLEWAEEALRESEEKYRYLFNELKDAVFLADAETGHILDTNKQGEVLLGRTREDIIGMHQRELHPPGKANEYRQRFAAHIEKGHSADYDGEVIRKDGTIVSVNISAAPITMGGKPLIIGLFRDITERKEVEELYRTLANSSPVGVYIVQDGKCQFVNPQFQEDTGYTEDELLGMESLSIVHPEDREKVRENAVEMLKGNRLSPYEFRVVNQAGETKWVLETVSSIHYKGKRATLGNFMDITERKKAEEALRESEERYRALVNLGGSVGQAIIMIQDTQQGDAIQTFVSNEWLHITGYTRKELLGMSFFDLLHPTYQQASLGRHRRKMKGEIIPGFFEMSIIKKDGTEVPIELTSAYTTYKGERANVAFIRDITERKQAEERERRLQQELLLSSRLASIGELAAGVAHQINNPLTGVIGFSQRLLKKSTDEETKRDLARVVSEAQRAAKIVGSLLVFARRRGPEREYSDINDILGRTLELRAYELRTSNIDLAVELAPDLPRTMANFQQIEEVFLNLILNVEQAMTEANRGGKLSIKTQQVDDRIRISFADDGPGIPAEALNKVFDPFFTTRGDRGGTGLGLSVCYGIMTDHGGSIYAQSKPGKGSTFFVELPVVPQEG